MVVPGGRRRRAGPGTEPQVASRAVAPPEGGPGAQPA